MKIIFSIGDCNGIGIEVMLKAITTLNEMDVDFVIAANSDTLREYVSGMELPVEFKENGIRVLNKFCSIIECPSYSPVEFGKESASAGKLAGESIEIALKEVFSRKCNAIVTMPISKYSLNMGGWHFAGHTEMLADRSNVKNPLMLLCSGNMRVALATMHIPIAEVPTALSKQLIVEKIQSLNFSLKGDFGIEQPRIAVLGLNPHSGELGNIGKEEIQEINPAIEFCSANGIQVLGAFPADGFFAHREHKEFDGILAMYHDQGLIPLKMEASITGGVNFTAGLPIVRTSPDHGTAFSIAGKNIADSQSTIAAILLAEEIHKNRTNFHKS